MATGITVWATNQIMKQWVVSTIVEMERLSNVTRFIGDGPNSIIQRKTDLQKGRGDTIYFDLIHKLTGSPVINEAELAGNEEKMEFTTDSVALAEMAFAVKKYGEFEDIKTVKNMKALAKAELALRLREVFDSYIIRLLCGDTTLSTATAWTGTASTTNRKLYGGDWDGASAIDTGDDWMRVRDITRAKTHARVTAGMRPVIVDGVETYVVLVHPYVWARIRAFDPDYENAVLYARERGPSNPLFSGMSGWWDGCAIFENDHLITNATYSTAYRSLLLGAQAGMLGMGKAPWGSEQDYDYKRKLGIAISMLWGFKKTVMGPDDFQGASTYTDDYGVITIDGYGAVTAGLASDTES
jgi:N4-gp56 family major capsid protein